MLDFQKLWGTFFKGFWNVIGPFIDQFRKYSAKIHLRKWINMAYVINHLKISEVAHFIRNDLPIYIYLKYYLDVIIIAPGKLYSSTTNGKCSQMY